MRDVLTERRKALRINIGLCVQYKQKEGNWDICIIRNFSEAGLCLTTRAMLQAGTMLMFRMKIPLAPGDYVEFFAKVIDCQASENLEKTYFVRSEMTNIIPAHKNLVKLYLDWFYKNNTN